MSSLERMSSQMAPSTIVAPGDDRLYVGINSGAAHAVKKLPDAPLQAVTDYLRDAGVRDPELLSRESRRIVAAAQAELSADDAEDDVQLTTMALRRTIEQMEAWMYEVPATTPSESSAAPRNVAVKLPELLRRVGESMKRNRPEEVEIAQRDCSIPVVPTSRLRPMRQQRLKLAPTWCRRLFDPANSPDGVAEKTNEAVVDEKPSHSPSLTPLRFALMALTLLSAAAGTWWYVRELLAGGVSTWLDVPLTGLFAVLFTWVAFSFWTATIGLFVVLRKPRRSAEARTEDNAKPLPTTAVVMTVYNEDPQVVFANLRAVAASLQTTGRASDFHLFALSDATDPKIRLEEERAWADLAASLPDGPALFYRHRTQNTGRKAGNLAEFCRRWGTRYRYMVVLDADSVMAGETLVEMVRRMEREPDVGILQVPPLPVNRRSFFARLQQFAAHVYGPVFLEGFALWTQEDGNYWGHNAIIRVQPFMEHCDLPLLPGEGPLGGEILSHDFVEAALMRRAGWKVRLAHDLGGSFEECPATILGYAKRDQRWCQGNLQHLKLLLAEGFHPISRIHLGMGAMSYLTSPLWLTFLILSLVESILLPSGTRAASDSLILFGVSMTLLLLPKLWGVIALLKLAEPAERRTVWKRVGLGVMVEVVVSMLVAPIMMLLHTTFVISTLRGTRVQWNAQSRTDDAVSFRDAMAVHLGHTLIGATLSVIVALWEPRLLIWLAPILLSLLLSIPLSMLLGSVRLGRGLAERGLLLIPAEVSPPAVLQLQHAALNALHEAEARRPSTELGPFESKLRDPACYVLHRGILRATNGGQTMTAPDWKRLQTLVVNEGLAAVPPSLLNAALNDPQAGEFLHLHARTIGR